MVKVEPGPRQESVWNYPRPPRVEECDKEIRVIFNGAEIARSTQTQRVLETSHPPVYYIPPQDVRMECLESISGTTHCEWKGQAKYFDVMVQNKRATKAAWCYPDPTDDFKSIAGSIAFYAHKVGACYVSNERVDAQQGGFYGGWITSDIVGPFKGKPGSAGW